MATDADSSSGLKWLPLEANPDVMNKVWHSVQPAGLSDCEWESGAQRRGRVSEVGETQQ